jgi:hypothetical protein
MALILLNMVLAGCGSPDSISTADPPAAWCHDDFRNLMPQGWVLVPTPAPLDTDGDGIPECVIFYRLDAEKNVNKISTVGGVVYRRDHGGPPRWVYPCPLQPPNDSHLGEHAVSARAADVLSGFEGLELIIEDKDPEGNIVQATLFGWRDSRKSQPDAPPNLKEMYYQLLGLFRGEGGVEIIQDRAIVTDTIGGTRSRLANRMIYTPINSTTYLTGTPPKPVSPTEVELVALIECKDPKAVCYPEKSVLDFYHNIKDYATLEGLMTDTAFADLQAGKLKYGCLPDRTLLDRVLVQGPPTISDGDEPQVTVKVKCQLKDGSLKDMTKSPVTWTLKKNAEGRWLIKSATQK